MHQAAYIALERVVREFAEWRTVAEDERSPAPAWWWAPAFEARNLRQPMPAAWCSILDLPEGSATAAGASVLLASLAGQNSLAYANDFPRNAAQARPP